MYIVDISSRPISGLKKKISRLKDKRKQGRHLSELSEGKTRILAKAGTMKYSRFQFFKK